MSLYTIPPDAPFVDSLATGLWTECAKDPFLLSDMTIFLPTRRACRALRDAFLRISDGAATLLPKMMPLGDVDEDPIEMDAFVSDLPPAIPALRRTLLLASLIQKKDDALPVDQAVELARALSRLLDEVQTNEKSFDGLESLVVGDLAEHWQQTVSFLKIVTDHWPELLRAEGCMDPIARRNALLRARAKAWAAAPPTKPMIAAGSTASVPAVAEMLRVIASLPQGRVILPGLDQDLDEESWQSLGEGHPQYGMRAFLAQCKTKREDVKIWPAAQRKNPARARLWRETMLPPERTETWRSLTAQDLAGACDGFARLEAEHPEEEAQAIALCLRGVLETEGKTAALVTPDRGLGERVASALRRWGIAVDDSAGQSLPRTSLGSFLFAILDACTPSASGVAFLTLLKNPHASCGVGAAQCRAFARRAELALWRGLRRADGLRHAAETWRASDPEGADFLCNVAGSLALLADAWAEEKPLEEWLALHSAVAEKLAQDESGEDLAALWAGDAGEAAAQLFADARLAAAGLPAMNGATYGELVRSLMRAVALRPQRGISHRLSILGPLEARLWHPDLVILGGMNEGTWPPVLPVDPWLSRPMKRNFGLPLPERRVGLSAHDVAQLGCAAEVLITRARRSGGAPTVPSRFLLQLEAVLNSAYGSEADPLRCPLPWADWARLLDRPDSVQPCAQPAPCPPVEYRPRKLSVTEIGLWQRNPYGLYAKRILRLRKLDELEEEVKPNIIGSIFHAAFENFVKQTKDEWPDDPLALLEEEGAKAFAPLSDRPQVAAFLLPRFRRCAAWFIDQEEDLREKKIVHIAAECQGTLALAPDFTLTGRADRLDLWPDGSVDIIDYKTGGVPSGKDISQGIEPQMSLLALIALNGGFAGLQQKNVGALTYYRLGGGRNGCEVKRVKGDAAELAERARDGLLAWVDAFRDPAMPYTATPRSRYASDYDDYRHLARQDEWRRE